MARWKLLGRSKATQKTEDQIKTVSTETPATQQPQRISEQEHHEETPVMEYNETLYTQTGPVRKPLYPSEPRPEMKYRSSWENPNTIEENVDRIRTRKAEDLSTHPDVDDKIERKVDRLIAKKKVPR